MIRSFILLFVTLCIFDSTKADTIDYWHVYYNNSFVREYNQHLKGELSLQIKDIKVTDSFTIKYFRDTHCNDCEVNVSIESRNKIVVSKGQSIGVFTPIKVSVFDVLQHERESNEKMYQVYYYENGDNADKKKVLIFRIRLN